MEKILENWPLILILLCNLVIAGIIFFAHYDEKKNADTLFAKTSAAGG